MKARNFNNILEMRRLRECWTRSLDSPISIILGSDVEVIEIS